MTLPRSSLLDVLSPVRVVVEERLVELRDVEHGRISVGGLHRVDARHQVRVNSVLGSIGRHVIVKVGDLTARDMSSGTIQPLESRNTT